MKSKVILMLILLPIVGYSQSNLTALLFQLIDCKDARNLLENEGWRTTSVNNIHAEYDLYSHNEYNLSKNIRFNNGNASIAYITIKEYDNDNKSISLKFYEKSFYDKFKEILTKSGYEELSNETNYNTIELIYTKDPIEIFLKEKLNDVYQITIFNYINDRDYTRPPPDPSSNEILIIEEEEEAIDEVFMVVEDMPLFQGCTDDWCTQREIMKYIAKNVQYPAIAKENNITGRVFVSFIIDKSGNVTNVKLVRGVDKYLDTEAVRVIQSLPTFTPGKQFDKAVRVQYNIPINFQLN